LVDQDLGNARGTGAAVTPTGARPRCDAGRLPIWRPRARKYAERGSRLAVRVSVPRWVGVRSDSLLSIALASVSLDPAGRCNEAGGWAGCGLGGGYGATAAALLRDAGGGAALRPGGRAGAHRAVGAEPAGAAAGRGAWGPRP